MLVVVRGVRGDPRLAVMAEEDEPALARERAGAAVAAVACGLLDLGLGTVGVLEGLFVGLLGRLRVAGGVGRVEAVELRCHGAAW